MGFHKWSRLPLLMTCSASLLTGNYTYSREQLVHLPNDKSPVQYRQSASIYLTSFRSLVSVIHMLCNILISIHTLKIYCRMPVSLSLMLPAYSSKNSAWKLARHKPTLMPRAQERTIVQPSRPSSSSASNLADPSALPIAEP